MALTGNPTRFKDQWLRLQFATIDWAWRKGAASLGAGIRPLQGYCTFWDPDQPEVPSAFRSKVVLNQRLYEEMVRAAVPFDLRALRELALQHSPLGMDLYLWLTSRQFWLLSTARPELLVRWPALAVQFGSAYERPRAFKVAFVQALRSVLQLYPGANAVPVGEGVLVRRGRTHVEPRHAALSHA